MVWIELSIVSCQLSREIWRFLAKWHVRSVPYYAAANLDFSLADQPIRGSDLTTDNYGLSTDLQFKRTASHFPKGPRKRMNGRSQTWYTNKEMMRMVVRKMA